MQTLRVLVIPRERVPLAVNTYYGETIGYMAHQHDLWREADRFMRTAEFTLPMGRARKWSKRQDGWALREDDDA